MAAPAYAFTSAIQGVVSSGYSGVASCKAEPFLDTFTDGITKINGTATSSVHFIGAAGYTPTSDKKICKAEFKLDCKYASCSTTTYYAALYTKSGTSLDTIVGEVSSGVTGSNAWSGTTVTFTFPGSSYPEITTSGTYAIVYYSDPVGDGAGTSMTMAYTSEVSDLHGGWAQYATDKIRTDYASATMQVRLYAYE